MAEVTITNQNFEQEVLNSDIPVLVDFWAPWCGPCRMLSPIIEQIAEEYAGIAKIGKVNIDEQPELAAKFEVASIPTVIIFKNGQISATSIGYKPKSALENLLK